MRETIVNLTRQDRRRGRACEGRVADDLESLEPSDEEISGYLTEEVLKSSGRGTKDERVFGVWLIYCRKELKGTYVLGRICTVSGTNTKLLGRRRV